MTRDEKVKSFIGWKSPDGKLEVIGIADKTDKNGRKLFKVTCTECSKDLELFPDGYFVSARGDLERGGKPCGCSKRPSWKDWQYLILAHRAGEKKGFIVYGFAENFKGITTRLNLECLKDGYRWRAITHNIINSGYGCPKCKYEIQKELQKTPEHIALQKCIDICKEIGYDVIGFVEGYKNQRSRFEYVCKVHGKQSVIYGNFVDKGTRCGDCAKHSKGFYGYYPERKDETDFLYILNFNDKFIKVGRSFDVDERIKSLKKPSESGIKKIHKLRIFTATHKEIYDYEQKLHMELRERNFQHNIDWSTECFENESLFILNKLLDDCELEEV